MKVFAAIAMIASVSAQVVNPLNSVYGMGAYGGLYGMNTGFGMGAYGMNTGYGMGAYGGLYGAGYGLNTGVVDPAAASVYGAGDGAYGAGYGAYGAGYGAYGAGYGAYGAGYGAYGAGYGGLYGYNVQSYDNYGRLVISSQESPAGVAPEMIPFPMAPGSDGNWVSPKFIAPEYNAWWGSWDYNQDSFDYPFYGGVYGAGYGGVYGAGYGGVYGAGYGGVYGAGYGGVYGSGYGGVYGAANVYGYGR